VCQWQPESGAPFALLHVYVAPMNAHSVDDSDLLVASQRDVNNWRSSWLPLLHSSSAAAASNTIFSSAASASNTIFALRGISGAGKSYVAREICSSRGGESVIASADNYFINADGIYTFNPSQLRDAHLSCSASIRDAIARNIPTIIVDNTCTKAWEVADVERIILETSAATTSPYKFVILEIGNFRSGRTAALGYLRNLHSVPWTGIVNQYTRFETDIRAIQIPIFINSEENKVLNSRENLERAQEAESSRMASLALLAPKTAETATASTTTSTTSAVAITLTLQPSLRTLRRIAFTALFLTKSSRLALTQAAPILDGALPCADHITLFHALASNIKTPLTPELALLIGTQARVKVRGFVASDGIVAATVSWSKVVRRSLTVEEEDGEEEDENGDDNDDDAGSRKLARALTIATVNFSVPLPPRHALGLNHYPHVTVAACQGVAARTSNDVLVRNGGSTSGKVRPRLWLSVRFGVAVFDSMGVNGRLNIYTADAWDEWLLRRSERENTPLL
jgi:hypothetical protein